MDGWVAFRSASLRPIKRVDRIGKALGVMLEGDVIWHIHLNSTGWWLPGNSEAEKAIALAPIHEQFLHIVNDKTIRLKAHFSDGQIWHYHDSRTWGKWYLRNGANMRDDPYFAKYGPDWLTERSEARTALINHKSGRTLKDVLCDQKVTSGLGNYLACEIAFKASIHPHRIWNQLTLSERFCLPSVIEKFVDQSMESDGHEHWGVFKRDGLLCPRDSTHNIAYVKDKGGQRGSYFCPTCQPPPES